ncbi:hypothetical protein KGM_200230 [Danaus plexippus plexippus]|uniref:Uncharacterized protein n=1 Tax=Danaus plexippus plexippus TaxID=278856 RepID=A0A212FB30_DANPL|nr:hypothetical protein KGM_200230 [Danaus plexippus plexippus]
MFQVWQARVELVEDTSVPIGDNLVQVTICDADCGDYCTRPRQFSMGNVVYSVASSVLRNGKGFIRVCNIGTRTVGWKKGTRITRAVKCILDPEVRSHCFTLRRGVF